MMDIKGSSARILFLTHRPEHSHLFLKDLHLSRTVLDGRVPALWYSSKIGWVKTGRFTDKIMFFSAGPGLLLLLLDRWVFSLASPELVFRSASPFGILVALPAPVVSESFCESSLFAFSIPSVTLPLGPLYFPDDPLSLTILQQYERRLNSALEYNSCNTSYLCSVLWKGQGNQSRLGVLEWAWWNDRKGLLTDYFKPTAHFSGDRETTNGLFL